MISRSSQAADNANYALRTYYNYIRAWLLTFEQEYGSGQEGIGEFVHLLTQSANLSRVPGTYRVQQNLRDAYNRGQLTLEAIRSLPIDQYPELAISANFWLPVQAYYAVHGFGVACLIALGKTPPSSHFAFRINFMEIARQYLPPPICTRCSGGPEKEDFSFLNLNTTAAEVIAQNNLETPTQANARELIGKSLSTTRRDRIKEKFSEQRKNRRKKKLSLADRCEICEDISATSICDFLYRMRVRSNYESPDMYIYTYPEEASRHYKDLSYLTEVIIAGLKVIIEGKLGIDRVSQLQSSF